MPTIEEIDSDEEEKPQPKEPIGDFNSIMQKAAEMKGAQLKEKRREWEAAPEWYKNTMSHERQGEVMESRKKSFEERIELAEKNKVEGNQFYTDGKFKKALDAYVKSIAAFRYFAREEKGEMIRQVFEDETLNGEEKMRAHALLVSAFLNTAQCCIKARMPLDGVFACDQALRIDPQNAKAYYRRGIAQIAGEDTSTSLEKGVKDLTRAYQLSPDDPAIKAALKQHGQELAEQTRKDKKVFGGMFNNGELYSRAEQERIQKNMPLDPKNADPALQDEDLKRRAKAAGIDLDDPKVRAKLEKQYEARREAEMREKAKEMGIDLEDPAVQKMLELMEKEKELEEMRKNGEFPEEQSLWRKVLMRALSKNSIFNLQNIVYLMIAMNVCYRCYQMFNQQIPKSHKEGAEDDDYGHSVWASKEEF